MSNEEKYFDVLSAAMTQIDADSFEARGVVYDRLWKVVLQQLRAEQDDSEESIARERAAFLGAVQRIEFGQGSPPPADDGEAESIYVVKRSGRSMLGRIVLRMASACAVLVVIWLSYVLIVVRVDSASAERWVGEGAANSWQAQVMRAALSLGGLIERRPVIAPGTGQRAVLYEESASTTTGTTYGGTAVWRHVVESAAAGPSGTVLSIDVEIPQKSLTVSISLKRAPDGGGVISHFVEFRFLNSDRSASDAIEDVRGILMKNDELARGIELAGKVVRVQRGEFLMGLSGADADLGRNLKLLKERPWLDIPMVMKNGSRSILAVEKGSTGESAVNQVLVSWGQS